MSIGLKVNLGKTKVMVSGGNTTDDLSKSKVYSCWVWIVRLKANSASCVQCSSCLHSRCAGVQRVTPKWSRNFAFSKCYKNTGEAVEQKEKLCNDVEAARVYISK